MRGLMRPRGVNRHRVQRRQGNVAQDQRTGIAQDGGPIECLEHLSPVPAGAALTSPRTLPAGKQKEGSVPVWETLPSDFGQAYVVMSF
jgi:hypothetical protein